MFDLSPLCSQLCANCSPPTANNRPCQSFGNSRESLYSDFKQCLPFSRIISTDTGNDDMSAHTLTAGLGRQFVNELPSARERVRCKVICLLTPKRTSNTSQCSNVAIVSVPLRLIRPDTRRGACS